MAKKVARRRNVQMGFRDSNGVFHPIRASSDYDDARDAATAHLYPRKKKGKKKNSAHSAKMRFFRPAKKRAKKKNPVKIAATMSGKSTGWMPAQAVRVRVVKGVRIVDVKKK